MSNNWTNASFWIMTAPTASFFTLPTSNVVIGGTTSTKTWSKSKTRTTVAAAWTYQHNLVRAGCENFTLSRPRGHFVSRARVASLVGGCSPSPNSQHIFKMALSLELLRCDFPFYVFFVQKSSVPPISRHVCSHGNHAISGLFLRTRIAIVFQVFPPERNFL